MVEAIRKILRLFRKPMTPNSVITVLRSTLLMWVCCVVVMPARSEDPNNQAQVYEVQFVDSDTRNKHVSVEIGGKEYLFTFDTGCSSMALNRRVLTELQKAGVAVMQTGAENKAEVMMSNGETKQSHSVVIKSLKIGGCEFTNVAAQAGINDRSDAPLLLGQSILERLRTYSIEGCTLRFEPYEDDYQQALALADHHRQERDHAPQIAEALMPYYRAGRLSCYYTYRLLYALQQSDAYSDALEVIEHIRQQNWKESRDETDLADIESLLHYNIGVDHYNADRYNEALDCAARAKQCAQAIRSPQAKQKRLHDVGTLYYYIYSQTDPQKARAYERYK